MIKHVEEGRRLAGLGAENGYCCAKAFAYDLRCACRWLTHYRAGGVASLKDRCSGSPDQRRTFDPKQRQHAVELRHQRLHLRHIAHLLRAPVSTDARPLSRLGLG